MEKKHLLYGLKSSDVFVGQLADAFPAYTSVYEALAMGKTIIHKGNENDKTLYPILNAYDKASLTKSLSSCISGEVSAITIGNKAYEWFLQHGFNYPVNQVVEAIEKNTKSMNPIWGKIHCALIQLTILIVTPIEKVIFRLQRLKKVS